MHTASSQSDVEGIPIRLGIHRDGGNAELFAGANDPQGDSRDWRLGFSGTCPEAPATRPARTKAEQGCPYSTGCPFQRKLGQLRRRIRFNLVMSFMAPRCRELARFRRERRLHKRTDPDWGSVEGSAMGDLTMCRSSLGRASVWGGGRCGSWRTLS